MKKFTKNSTRLTDLCTAKTLINRKLNMQCGSTHLDGGITMKSGIIRRIDDLGRIAIPKEIRRVLRIHEGDSLEISIENGKVVLEPYIPTGDYKQAINKLIENIKADNGSVVLGLADDDTEKANVSFIISSLENIIKTLEKGKEE